MSRSNLTVLLTAGGTVGVLVAIYIIFRSVTPIPLSFLSLTYSSLSRAYRLLFITYCISLSRQTDETSRGVSGGEGGRVVIRLPRVRRTQDKSDSPPPPYDSPPPYHVAVVMSSEGLDLPPPPDIVISESVYI